MTIRWETDQAAVNIDELDDGRFAIEAEKLGEKVYLPRATSCITPYPLELIRQIYDLKGPIWLCDEISRDQDQSYIEKEFNQSIFSYVSKEDFSGKRVLDFGSGSGASSVVIARLIPRMSLIGVDLDSRAVNIATARAGFYGIENIQFLVSPDSESLPEVEAVDFIFLSAVYEHLLPEERKSVLPMLWDALKPGGIMFVYMTPYRWWPIEYHTTSGMPFLNYLPDSFALAYTRRFSKRNVSDDDWPTLLRKGIRGGSPGEILRILRTNGHDPVLVPPAEIGGKDCIDLWYHYASKNLMNNSFWLFTKAVKTVTGMQTIRTLKIGLQKPG